MDWVRLVVELTKEAMRGEGEEPEKPPEPTDLGKALAQQFAKVDRNLETVVRMVNAHQADLRQAQRRQMIWNIALSLGVAAAIGIALLN